MQNSKAYDCLIKQLNANGSEKMDGYYPEVMEEITGRTGHNLCVGGEYGIDAYYQ